VSELCECAPTLIVPRRWCADEQDSSYLRQPKIQPILYGAGFDHFNRHLADAAHLTPTANKAIDEAVDLLMPSLVEQEQRVAAALARATSFEQAKKDCLYCASGFLKYVRLCISLFVRGAAARPRDAKKRIVQSSGTLKEMFTSCSSPNRVHQLSYFSSPQFREVCGLIRAAEELELTSGGQMTTGINNTAQLGSSSLISPVAARISKDVRAEIEPLRKDLAAYMKGTTPQVQAQSPMPWQTPPAARESPKPKTSVQAAAVAAAAQGAASVIYHPQPVDTVATMWKEYISGASSLVACCVDVALTGQPAWSGLNGGPAIKELEAQHGTKWRMYYRGDDIFSKRSLVFNAIESLITGGLSAADAVAQIQEQHDALKPTPKATGRSNNGYWCLLFNALTKERQERKKRSREDVEVE